jgi:hypothetical protein
MDKEKEDQLFEEFPTLYEFRSKDDKTTLMGYGFGCDNGWFKLIQKLSKNLESINSMNLGFTVRAVQVKEKFGTLRFYYQTVGDEGLEVEDMEFWKHVLRGLVTVAENESYRTCEICGKYGELRRDLLWIRTMCEEDYQKKIAEIDQMIAEDKEKDIGE